MCANQAKGEKWRYKPDNSIDISHHPPFASRLHRRPWNCSELDETFMIPEAHWEAAESDGEAEDAADLRRSRTHPRASATKMGRALERLGLTLLEQTSVSALSLAAVHVLRSTLQLKGVLLWCYEPRGRLLHLSAAAGLEVSHTATLEAVSLDALPSAASLAVSRRSTLFLPSTECSTLTQALEGSLMGGGTGSLLAVPLIAEGQVLGALEFIGMPDDYSFASQRSLLEKLTLMTAVGLNRARQFEELERQAASDALTGIPNRRTVTEFLQSRMAESRRASRPLALLLLDVDHFRLFNEEAGHDEGDEVLKGVAEILRRSIRAYDLAGRYGGEEFMVVLPGADETEAMQAAERIRRRIANLPTKASANVTASIGAALFPDSAEEADVLIKTADRALYRAKRQGRDQVCLASWQDQSQAAELSDLVIGLTNDAGQAAAEEALQGCSDQLGSLKISLGLRIGHLDQVRAALALYSVTQAGGLTDRLMDETESGDLRAVNGLLANTLSGNLSAMAAKALYELLKGTADGSFGPIEEGCMSQDAPAA